MRNGRSCVAQSLSSSAGPNVMVLRSAWISVLSAQSFSLPIKPNCDSLDQVRQAQAARRPTAALRQEVPVSDSVGAPVDDGTFTSSRLAWRLHRPVDGHQSTPRKSLGDRAFGALDTWR